MTALQVTTPAPRAVWRALLCEDPNALPSQTPEWMDCLVAFGTYEDASRLYELPGGRQLVLPMARRHGPVGRLAGGASLPAGWGLGGVVAPGGVDVEGARMVFADLARVPGIRNSLRPGPLQAPGWAAARPPEVTVVPRLAHILDLDGGFDHVWSKRFAGTARTAVRKAERSGLTVERDTSGRLIPVLYELFERSLARWAGQQHEPAVLARWRGRRRDPIEKLQLLARDLGAMCRTWVAWHGNRPAAAILVLQGANAHYTRGAMDKEIAAPTRANYLLHRMAIADACESGCRFYYMGESGSSQSLAQFKTRLGARPSAHAEYHFERLPLTAIDAGARSVVKRLIGFRD
jgi:Acetyltransferase (GNAT) domain